ncbi:MAG: hypothetical protein ACOYBE_13150 [Blautia sp.]
MKSLWERFWYRMNHDPFFAYFVVCTFIGFICGIIGILYGIAIGYFD